MGNPICGPLNKHEMNLGYRINMSSFNSRFFTDSLKGLEALSSHVPIIPKNSKEMRFLLLKVVIIRDSQRTGSKGAENTKFLSRKMMRTSMKILFHVSFFCEKTL